jgi:hypothetical protein
VATRAEAVTVNRVRFTVKLIQLACLRRAIPHGAYFATPSAVPESVGGGAATRRRGSRSSL